MAVKKAGHVLVDLLIGRNEIPEEAERARQSLQRLGEAETSFQRLAQTVNRAGIEIGNRLDYIAQRMEQQRQRFIAAIQAMENKTTTAAKMIDNLSRFASPLRVLDQQFLKIGDSLERMAQKGHPAVTALRLLGPNASMRELVMLTDQINQGIGRMNAVALGSAVVFGLMTFGMIHLSNAIDGRLVPATKRLGEVWAEALEPFTHVWTDVVLVILKAAEAVGRFFAELAEGHPVLSSMIWGFLYLLPLVTLFLAPLAIAIDRTNALRVAFYALWQTIKPFVLGFLSVIGTAAAVTAAIVGLAAAISMMWKYSAQFRNEVVQTWTQIKKTVSAAVAPISKAFDQLKQAFLNFVATLFGAKPTMKSIWKEIGNDVAVLIDYLAGIFVPVIKVVFQAFAVVVTTVFNVITTAFRAFTSFWKANGNEIMATASAIWTAIEQTVGAVVDYLVQKFALLKAWWQQTWPTIAQTFVQIWGALSALVTTVVGDLFAFLTTQTGNFRSFWQATWPVIEQTVVQIWSAIWPIVTGLLADAVAFILSALQSMKAWWDANWPAIQRTIVAVWGAIWPFVKALLGDAVKFIVQKLVEIKNWWVETWPTLKEAVQNVWTVISTVIKVALTVIVALMQWAWPLVKSIVESAWNAIKQIVSGAIKVITGLITLFASILALDWRKAWDALKQITLGALQVLYALFNVWLLGRMVALVRGALVGIKNVVVAAFRGIVQFVKSALQQIVLAVGIRFGHVISTIKEFLGLAVATVKGFHHAFLEAGRWLIEGLVRGIASGIGRVISTAVSLAKSAANAVKSALGIASPSRVMMEYGRNIAEGLALGILQNRQKVVKASDEVSAQIREAFRVWRGLIDAQFEISVAGLDPERDKAAIMQAELQKLTDTMAALQSEAKALHAAWRIAAQAAGENSVQAVRLANDYYGVQVEIAKTQAEIKKLKTEMANLPAEQVIQKFEQTKNALDTTRQIAVTTFELMKLQLGENATKAHELQLEVLSLNEQIRIQQDRVRAASQAYNEMRELKGDTAEETRKLYLEYLQEEKALSELIVQHRKAQNALRDHAQALRDLAAEVQAAAQKYRDELAAAAEEYERKVREVNQRLAEDERRLWEEYERNLEQRAKAIMDFAGLFDAVEIREVSGETLLQNLQSQVDALQNWVANIQALAARGVDEGLIQELRQMGPKAGPEIAALLKLTDDQLAQYVALWREKQKIAREQAMGELENQRISTINKIMELRIQAAEQLEQYRLEWQRKNEEIRKNAEAEIKRIHDRFRELAEASTGYGINVMVNFINGIESQFDRLRSTLEAMAAMVDAYMPHSPAKVGPLKRIDEWGPGLVGTLVDGIRASLPRLANITERMAAVVPGALGDTYYSDQYTTNITGGNTINITVHASSYEDFKRRLERDLARYGIRF